MATWKFLNSSRVAKPVRLPKFLPGVNEGHFQRYVDGIQIFLNLPTI